MNDRRMGWPAALLTIDAPSDYHREQHTAPRPRLSEEEQEARRKLDVTKTRPSAPPPAAVHIWHDGPPPRYGWYIASREGITEERARYWLKSDVWSHSYRLASCNRADAQHKLTRIASATAHSDMEWLRPATAEDFGFEPPHPEE